MSGWAAEQDVRRRSRRLLIALGGVAAVVLLVCAGLVPVLLGGLLDDSGQNPPQFQFACGIEFRNLPDISGLSQEQVANASVIISVGRERKLPGRALVVAIATAMQESTLHNYTNAVDHDSLGLFQQRPTMGWGTPAQVTDPRYSAAKFYDRLARIAGWQAMRITDAAQRVQRSAFPNAYQKWEHLAVGLVAKLAGDALSSIGSPACAAPGQTSASGWTVPVRPIVVDAASHRVRNMFELGSGFRPPGRPNHKGVDLMAHRGTPIQAASGGIVITVRCQASIGTCDRDGGPSVKGCGWYVEVAHSGGVWTRYCHMGQRPSVVVGQRVNAGDLLGFVGSSGNSSGPHLHFEVHVGPTVINPVPFMAEHGAPVDVRSA
jgi:murein DD-endopeptidase MepM/ murein hydrolase activator NlpD